MRDGTQLDSSLPDRGAPIDSASYIARNGTRRIADDVDQAWGNDVFITCLGRPPMKARINIEQVVAKHEGRLMALPNVTAVGIGKRSGRDVITVFVTRKVPASQLSPEAIVPKSLDGVDTDVVESGVVTAMHTP
jgi:hypothetical protein